MPHLVGYYLTVGILHYKADFLRLGSQISLIKVGTVQIHGARTLALGSERRLEMPEQSCFSAAALAAEDNIFTLADGEIDPVKRVPVGERISEF